VIFSPDLRSAAMLLLLLLALAGCKHAPAAEEDDEDKLPTKPVPVEAIEARVATLRPSLEVAGTLGAIPERTASVSPRTTGWIEKVPVAEGQAVHAGDLLVELDGRPAEVDLERAEAAVRQQEAVCLKLKRGPLAQEIDMARAERDKAQLLRESQRVQLAALKPLRDRGEIPAIQHDAATAALRSAEADFQVAAGKVKLLEAGTRPEEIAEADAKLAGAKADLAAATLARDYCRITSPIDGIVTQLPARHGMYVERLASLVTVADLSSLFAEIRIPGAYLTQVRRGARVDVHVASLSSQVFSGTITRISGQADPATGNAQAFVLLNNPHGELRPELGCRGEIWLAEIPKATTVPISAIADREGTPVVTVVREGKAYTIAVKLGTEAQEQAQILEGVSPGDRIVTRGGYGLPDGCPVSVSP
jgi:HlyD family secretion protein